jgi:glycosyltransferase involved in cell wall biosynthesis
VTYSAPATATRPLVSIVAPVYNESATLPEFVRRIAAVCDTLTRYAAEIVLVDDGSTDDTLQVARTLIEIEPRLRVIELRRNFGQTAALQAGLSCATGEFVISMDSDLQHFPEDIPLFIEQAERGFDVVCGWRKDRQENALRRWPSRAANLLIKRVIGLELHDFGTTFRLYRADLLSHINLIGEEHRFVPALAHMVGARITEIPIKNIERPVGTSNYGIGRTFGVALDILFLYFSRFYATRPLRVFGKVAVALLLPGVLIAGALLVINLLTGEPTTRTRSGWFLLSALLMLSSLQVLLTGILAEVLARIFYRTGSGESFVVRREWNAAATTTRR